MVGYRWLILGTIPGRRIWGGGRCVKEGGKATQSCVINVALGDNGASSHQDPNKHTEISQNCLSKGQEVGACLSVSDSCWSGIIPGSLDSPKHLDCACPQDEKTSKALSKAPRHKSGGGGMCAQGRAPQCLSELV